MFYSIDEEVRWLLTEVMDRAVATLEERREVLDRVDEALQENEEIDGDRGSEIVAKSVADA